MFPIRLTGAEILVRLLERQGVDLIAGIPGGANLPLYDALSRSRTIRHVLARHEQGAGFIAQGQARLTGRPGVCFATSGPGAANLMTAVADAKLDSVPLVCVTGQIPRPLIGTDAFQELDAYGMSAPIAKHNYLVRSAAELLRVIPQAFRIAASGRPGPVLVDLPRDVQTEIAVVEEWPEPGRPDPSPPIDAEALELAAELINRARRPILYLGGGVIQAEAGPAAQALAERIGAPVVMSLLGLGAVPAGHPLELGMLGMHASPCANLALEECDLLLAAGARFDDRATGKVSRFCPNAAVVHIDIDPGEIDKIKTAHVGLHADAGQALAALLPLVRPKADPAWPAFAAELKRRHPVRPSSGPPPTDLTRPRDLIRFVAGQAGPEAVVVTDVGQHQMWTAQTYPFARPRRWLTSGGLGVMGFGLPAAIGAALARPDLPVVCFSGDGSILMNIQELATAAELGVNLKIIVLNNGGLGLVRQQQDFFFGRNYFASSFASSIDHAAVARGFGLAALDLATSDDPAAALAEALASPGPLLVHVPVDAAARVYPMTPPGAALTEMIQGEDHVRLPA